MPEIVLPFNRGNNRSAGGIQRSYLKDNSRNILSSLPKESLPVVQKNPHLLEYLHMVPVKDFGFPNLHDKLDRSMGNNNKPNIIYPVKEGVFAHIIFDATSFFSPYDITCCIKSGNKHVPFFTGESC